MVPIRNNISRILDCGGCTDGNKVNRKQDLRNTVHLLYPLTTTNHCSTRRSRCRSSSRHGSWDRCTGHCSSRNRNRGFFRRNFIRSRLIRSILVSTSFISNRPLDNSLCQERRRRSNKGGFPLSATKLLLPCIEDLIQMLAACELLE
jgi:hypothetical protein